MKNEITYQLKDLVTNFAQNAIEANWYTERTELNRDASIAEDYVDSTALFLADLKNLLSSKATNVIGTLRKLFRQGFTMMFVHPNDMDLIEQWNKDDQDFIIIVKDNEETFCVLVKREIWF